MTLMSFLLLALTQAPPTPGRPPLTRESGKPLEHSAFLAFVDHEFIFTVEVVKPGVPLFNFVSMSDNECNLLAKNVRLTLESRKVPGLFFLVDTGNPKEPMIVPSVRMRPRSSFGVRLQGDFGQEKELMGATIRVGDDDLKLAPLARFEFENLVLKVNRINLESPDFREDWAILKLEVIGTRGPAARR
jgi:hypothetical protein